MFKTRTVAQAGAKLQLGAKPPRTGIVSVIVRVNRAGHVPEGVRVRSRIDDMMFTADVDAGRLDELAADPAVEAVSTGTPIQPAS